ncbi:unnamed protein product [Arabidopsis arenosa]|uniref:F-box domain-containing protein n=1 Tax=Arabidopsis arenosa TaxID=38785 RepID=A0A8S2ADD8_ARAAE|nr:unnamed protein product [Arabidopsis arenosa]
MESRNVDWSEMCSDALQLILESLSFPDFHRARTVCSSWYSVSKSCVAGSRNRYPWLILFPEKSSVSGSCTLFDPVEDKTYKTRDLGNEFSECRCLASYGNWLLMLTPRIDFYVLNVFTGERINLPSLSLQGGKVRFRRKDDGGVFLEHSPKDRETIINRVCYLAATASMAHNGTISPTTREAITTNSLNIDIAIVSKVTSIKKMEPRDADWSEMCSDAMKLILESLSFPDFHRARTVCSSWYSVSKSCVAGSRSRYPWLILFPNFSGSCTLFDPVENKTYKTRNPGKSRCLASYGNWLLMLTPRLDFFVLNVFTCERISLPSLSLQGGKVRFQRKDDGGVLFLEHSPKDRETIMNWYIMKAVLWIDEKTKDFVYIKILDFSDDFPKEIVEENPYLNHRVYYTPEHSRESWRERVAITSSGDVLIIVSIRKTLIENQEKPYFFKIFKMNVEGTEWERVDSLGDEMLVFGDGFIKGNLIYFVSDDSWDPLSDQPFQSSTGVYDLSTTEKRWSRFAYCLSNIRWFVPGSDNK